jgi:aromatic ring-opening dioxygenase catalytic subunit (LigB family)
MSSTSPARQPTLFIPHGGGPCFFMETPPGLPSDMWDKMAAYLRGIADDLPERPRAVLVISGHWEEPAATVNTATQPSLLFDYYGFPEHTYHLTYPAAGSPELAARVRGLLAEAGIASAEDAERGLDHGVFVPFKLIFPDASIPVVQLSLLQGLDPQAHLALGRALAPLRDEGVLIVGSGMSYHNLRHFMRNEPVSNGQAVHFDRWLVDTVTDADPRRRDQGLTAWAEAPDALACHPRAEHLLPLMVAAGAAGDDLGRQSYGEPLLGKPLSGFRFG